MPLPQVARIGQGLEAGLPLEVMEEAAQKLRSLLAGLVRDGLLERCVQGVEEFEQNLQHLCWRRLADAVARQDVLRAQARPVLAADRLKRCRAAGSGGALDAAAVRAMKVKVCHGSVP